jgi:hypothetical protein
MTGRSRKRSRILDVFQPVVDEWMVKFDMHYSVEAALPVSTCESSTLSVHEEALDSLDRSVLTRCLILIKRGTGDEETREANRN